MNRAHPVGSMIEGYNIEEVIESCLGYLKDNVSLGFPIGKIDSVALKDHDFRKIPSKT